MRTWLAAAVAATIAACSAPPDELVPGMDACEYCRMTISDARFGGQVVTSTGKVLTFDAVECLASYVPGASDVDRARVRVADFDTRRLVPVDSVVFIVDGSVSSPMGRSIVAFHLPRDTAALARRYGGRPASWDGIIDLMRAERIAPGAGPADTGTAHGHGEPR